jgi:hypothetical protein
MRRILHGLAHHLCNVRFCYWVNWGFIQVHFTALLWLAHDFHIHLIPGLTAFFSGVHAPATRG